MSLRRRYKIDILTRRRPQRLGRSTVTRGSSHEKTNESHSFCIPDSLSHHRGWRLRLRVRLLPCQRDRAGSHVPSDSSDADRAGRGCDLVPPRGADSGTDLLPRRQNGAYGLCASAAFLCRKQNPLCAGSDARQSGGAECKRRGWTPGEAPRDYNLVHRRTLPGRRYGGKLCGGTFGGLRRTHPAGRLFHEGFEPDVSAGTLCLWLGGWGAEPGCLQKVLGKSSCRYHRNHPGRWLPRPVGGYGPQDGDGTPTISGEEQIRQTAEAIAAFAAR